MTALENAEVQSRISRLDAEEIAPRIEAPDVKAEVLAQGTAIDVSVDGGSSIRQHFDQVSLEFVELTLRRNPLQGQLMSLEEQITAIGADFASWTTFTPGAAVVWRAAPAEGTSVVTGDTLMQVLGCQNRFIEVSLPGRLYESSLLGDTATFKLRGSTATIDGTVRAVGGAGVRFDHPSVASDSTESGVGDFQVLVCLDPADLIQPDVAGSFCDVGRNAEVRFQRDPAAALDGLMATVGLLGDWAQPVSPSLERSDGASDSTGGS